MTTLTWLGHSAWRLDTAELKVVIDPFFTGNPSATLSADQIEADYLIVTHGHSDHVGDVVSIAQRTGATVISNFEICHWVQKQGVRRIHAMNTGGAHDFPFGNLKLTIAHHTSMLPDGSDGGSPVGLRIRLKEAKSIYLAGDTGLFYDMKLIGEEGIDLAVLPIGDNYTMGPDDALRAVKLIQPRRVVPTHYNTWPLIAQDAGRWADRVRRETGIDVAVIQPGESISL